MERGGRRGSYFFVLDAFMASAILILTVALVYGLFLTPPSSQQSFAYASDYLLFLTTTQLRDYSSDVVKQMVASEEINDTQATIASQLLLFHNESRDDLAEKLLNDTATTLPAGLAIRVSVIDGTGGHELYGRGTAGAPWLPTHLASRSIEYATINDSAIYGPTVLLVEVWA